MILFILACLLPSLLISYFVTRAMIQIAPTVGLVDKPAARKVHTKVTPLGGGMGILLGFTTTLLAILLSAWLMHNGWLPIDLLPASLQSHLPGVVAKSPLILLILAAGLLLSIMGLFDDFRPTPWQPRLLVQMLICIAMIAGGVRATLFVAYPWIGYIVTFFWLMVFINSFNFLDNMDALSAGIALIAASLFAGIMLTQTAQPRWFVAGVLLILTGSLLGFLIHNRPPAKIFMGDSGSMFIGLMIGGMTVLGTFYDESMPSRHVILAPLCVLAIPLYDFTSVIAIRLKHGLSPFHPDKNHFSHRLHDLGLSKTNAVLTIHLATLTTGLGGILLYSLPDWWPALIVILMVFCVLTIIAILEVAARRNKPATTVPPQTVPPSPSAPESSD